MIGTFTPGVEGGSISPSTIQPHQTQPRESGFPNIRALHNTLTSNETNSIWDITNQLLQHMRQSQLIQNPSNVRFEQYDTPDGFHVSISEFNSDSTSDLPSDSGLFDSIMQLTNFVDVVDNYTTNQGLPKECKAKLPKALYKDAKTDDENSFMCTICQEEYSDNTQVLCLPCTHLFHEKCIDEWFNKSTECPNCRSNVSEDITRLLG